MSYLRTQNSRLVVFTIFFGFMFFVGAWPFIFAYLLFSMAMDFVLGIFSIVGIHLYLGWFIKMILLAAICAIFVESIIARFSFTRSR